MAEVNFQKLRLRLLATAIAEGASQEQLWKELGGIFLSESIFNDFFARAKKVVRTRPLPDILWPRIRKRGFLIIRRFESKSSASSPTRSGG
jgi:hypothetical protein